MMNLSHLQKAIIKENNKYLKMDIHTQIQTLKSQIDNYSSSNE